MKDRVRSLFPLSGPSGGGEDVWWRPSPHPNLWQITPGFLVSPRAIVHRPPGAAPQIPATSNNAPLAPTGLAESRKAHARHKTMKSEHS